MQLQTKDLILKTIAEGDVNEVAKVWDSIKGEISRDEAQKIIDDMMKGHDKNNPVYMYPLY